MLSICFININIKPCSAFSACKCILVVFREYPLVWSSNCAQMVRRG